MTQSLVAAGTVYTFFALWAQEPSAEVESLTIFLGIFLATLICASADSTK